MSYAIIPPVHNNSGNSFTQPTLKPNIEMADLKSKNNWCEKNGCNCKCNYHENAEKNQDFSKDIDDKNVVEDKIKTFYDVNLGDEKDEERMDMFEWMAKERSVFHKKREAVVHEYVSREPLKPEVVHQIPTPIIKTTESRDYLNANKIVKNMKQKWESIINARNPPLLNDTLFHTHRQKQFVKPMDIFNGLDKRTEIRQELNTPKPYAVMENNTRKATITINGITTSVDESNTRRQSIPPPEYRQQDIKRNVQNQSVMTDEIMSHLSHTPNLVDAEVQTIIMGGSDKNSVCDEQENGRFSIKCKKHFIANPEFLTSKDNNEDFEEFQKVSLHKHQHRPSLKVNDVPKVHVSIEGLLPATSHVPDPEPPPKLPDPISEKHEFLTQPHLPNIPKFPHPIEESENKIPTKAPKLPDPIVVDPVAKFLRRFSVGVDISEAEQLDNTEAQAVEEENITQNDGLIGTKTHWYTSWFPKSAPPSPAIPKEEIEMSENYEPATTHNLEISDENTMYTDSSIALEIEGHSARRATIILDDYYNNDELLLDDLAADYNDTIQEELESQVASIHKSKSQTNITTDELKQVAQNLSHKKLRLHTRDDKYDRDFHICHKCKRIIKHGDATFQFQHGHQTVWHRECFACTECQKQLGEMDHLFFENEPYCYDDYVKVAHVPRCKGCHELIFDPTYTSAAGHFWHKDHFVCYKCKRPLVDTKYVSVDGHVYCFSCHQRDFIRICKSCGQTILPHETYVQSGEYFWHSNDSCLHCQTCKRSLVGRSFLFRKAGFLYCNRYCSLGRGPPF